MSLRRARESTAYLFPERTSMRNNSKWLKRDREEANRLTDKLSRGNRPTRKLGQPLDLAGAEGVELLSPKELEVRSACAYYHRLAGSVQCVCRSLAGATNGILMVYEWRRCVRSCAR